MNDLGARLNSMKDGDSLDLVASNDARIHVRYASEQAMGDDNRPAKGYTIGWFMVDTGSGRPIKSFRHSPYKPNSWAGLAKSAAADDAIDYIRKVARLQYVSAEADQRILRKHDAENISLSGKEL